MQISQEFDITRYSIRSYKAGEIALSLPLHATEPAPEALDAIGPRTARIRQEIITRSMIITPGHLVRDWPPQTPAELMVDHIEVIVALQPEVALLGTGARLCWPATEVIAPLVRAGIGYEIMDTASACRTYNILMSDHRRVAAALMMI